jgi:hypothetical protein
MSRMYGSRGGDEETCPQGNAPCPYPNHIGRVYDRGMDRVDLTGGYCWSTSKRRNMCVQHAFLEGKKAEETSPRKSTPRTLKGVDQQYPGVCRAPPS